MDSRPRREGVAPRPRRSKTVWPWIFGVLLVVVLLLVLAWGLGWWDTDVAGDAPGT